MQRCVFIWDDRGRLEDLESQHKPEPKKVLFSGMQPTGTLMIGNYIGALRNFVLLEAQYDCLFCVVDMHAITVRQDPAMLRRRTLDLLALYIAAGLNPDKSIIYCQSHVPGHAELAWVLGCFTYMGELSRMTQFKDKSLKNEENINAGLFTYPALMAADILLYQAHLVPVGDDQKQHMELARDIAQRFNGVYGQTFVVPEAYIPKEGARIMSLKEPSRKMSKSDPEDTYITLLYEPVRIRKKLRGAVTDMETQVRYDRAEKPGISSLMEIMSVLSGKSLPDIESAFAGVGYGAFKDAVADAVVDALAPIQAEYRRLIDDKGYLERIMKQNAERASRIGARTLAKVHKKIGFVPRS